MSIFLTQKNWVEYESDMSDTSGEERVDYETAKIRKKGNSNPGRCRPPVNAPTNDISPVPLSTLSDAPTQQQQYPDNIIDMHDEEIMVNKILTYFSV